MQYIKIKYPDNQISVSITNKEWPYTIKERINSYEDLMFVLSIAEALQHNQIHNYHLEIPCLFGQRSDRRFEENNSFDLGLIIKILNIGLFKTVKVLDPHSIGSIQFINNCSVISPIKYVEETLKQIASPNIVLISPDAGAYKKVFDYGEKFGLPVVAAVKHRDLTGKIDSQLMGDVKDKDCLITDDICDGGYTFIVLAKRLKELGAKKVYLYISHAYFSKGFDGLKENIEHIYCTNSIKDVENGFITQFKVI